MSYLAILILAGGEGRRIGGAKPLKQFRGERLVDRVLRQAFSWSDLVVIAVRDPAQVEPVEARLIQDKHVPGPLGGLISGLEFARQNKRPFLLSIPTDMPFLPHDLRDRLRGDIGDHACALAASGGQLHPVCGLWRCSALDQVEQYAAAGRRSLKGLAGQLGFASVDWPVDGADPFFNVNTSEDLAEAARAAR
jgi:molybdopterin-guanine dinucleotide biosynthesis protein A